MNLTSIRDIKGIFDYPAITESYSIRDNENFSERDIKHGVQFMFYGSKKYVAIAKREENRDYADIYLKTIKENINGYSSLIELKYLKEKEFEGAKMRNYLVVFIGPKKYELYERLI